MSWLSDLFSSAPSGGGTQTPQWANTLQILGATLKDVGNQGRTNNVGATSQALQQHQQFVMQALARQQAAQAFGIGGGGPPNMDSMKSTLMGLIQAGVDPTPFIKVSEFGQPSPEQQRLLAKDKADATQADYATLDAGGKEISDAMKPSDVSLGSAAPGLSFQQRKVVAADEQRKAFDASPEGKAQDAAAVAKAQLPYQKELIQERSDAQAAEAAAKAQEAEKQAQYDLNDPEDKSYIESIANYKVRPPSNGRNPVQRRAAISAALKVNPDFTEAKFDQAQKALRDFGTGKHGDTARSLNVSVAHLETLRQLGRALENGDINVVNSAKQRFSEELGVAAPTNFDTAKAIVADEVAKGVIGGTTAQSDRETLAASLRRSRSIKQIEGSIDTFQNLLDGQLGGLRDQYHRTTGAKDFDQTFLSEVTRQALEGKKSPASGSAAIPPPGADGWTVMPNGVRVRVKK